MPIFIYCKVIPHVSGVTAPIIRSNKTVTAASGTGYYIGKATSLQRGQIGTAVPIWPRSCTDIMTCTGGCKAHYVYGAEKMSIRTINSSSRRRQSLATNEQVITSHTSSIQQATWKYLYPPPSGVLTARKPTKKLRYFRPDTHLSSRLGNSKRIDFFNNFLQFEILNLGKDICSPETEVNT